MAKVKEQQAWTGVRFSFPLSRFRRLSFAGRVLVATIAFWDFFLDWLGYRFTCIERLLRPAPLLLIKNGRLLRQNMKRELIREEELMAKLREHGIRERELPDVSQCYLEGDGRISVINRESI